MSCCGIRSASHACRSSLNELWPEGLRLLPQSSSCAETPSCTALSSGGNRALAVKRICHGSRPGSVSRLQKGSGPASHGDRTTGHEDHGAWTWGVPGRACRPRGRRFVALADHRGRAECRLGSEGQWHYGGHSPGTRWEPPASCPPGAWRCLRGLLSSTPWCARPRRPVPRGGSPFPTRGRAEPSPKPAVGSPGAPSSPLGVLEDSGAFTDEHLPWT